MFRRSDGVGAEARAAAEPVRSGRLWDHAVRIDDELLRRAMIEHLIAAWRIVQRNDIDIHDLRDRHAIKQDRLHQLTIVFNHRRLAGEERMAFGPAETKTDGQAA